MVSREININKRGKEVNSMKKIFAIILCAFVICSFAILGVSAASALTAPTVTLTDKTLSWTTVENAASYDVYSGDTLIATVTGTSVDLSGYLVKSGTYFVTVVAKPASNATSYTKSAPSTMISLQVAGDGFIKQILTEVGDGVGSFVPSVAGAAVSTFDVIFINKDTGELSILGVLIITAIILGAGFGIWKWIKSRARVG